MIDCAQVRARWLLLLAFSVATAGTPVQPAQLDNPCLDSACAHHALDHFAAALAAQRKGTAARALRISYFGDSLAGDDHIPNGLRERFGALLGPGGPGFVFAAPPHPFCEHRAVTRWLGGSWQIHGVSTTIPGDHLLGLGGSAESEGDGVIRLTPKSPVASIDVHYLEQPRGGELAVLADGTVLGTITTRGEAKRAEFAQLTVPDGAKKLELRATGRVRLFGATLEASKGVVVDNLGIVNATAKQFDHNVLPEHLKTELAHRASDLVIIMLGTNEAEWLTAKGAGMTEHEQVFGELLATIRAANPDSSCLVVSPLDQLDWRTEDMPPRASVPAMVAAQHRAATANGCAFWNVYEWMGGKGASRTWQQRGWLVRDYQHPTLQGGERLAEALYSALAK